jgi:regulator of sigma E protease
MDIVSILGYVLAIVAGLLLLVALVVIHELGHAIVAKRNGVEVEEFGIGFPPQAWSKKLKNGVLFTLNYLPLGGFVKLKGEHDADTQKGGYGAASLWVKTKILLAGVIMNWVTAVVIFTILAVVGMPKVMPGQAGGENIKQDVIATKIIDNSPAARIGMQVGDKITRLAGQELELATQLSTLTQEHAGETVPVTFVRDSQQRTEQVALNVTSGDRGYFGVSVRQPETEYIKAGWNAPVVGFLSTVQFTQLTFQGLGGLLSNLGEGIASKFTNNQQAQEAGSEALSQAGQGVAGPVGILGELFPSAVQAGIIPLLFLTGVISLTLAVMNVLPIPALDGGRLYTTLIFRALKKPLTKEREETIQATGFLALMALIVVVTVVDIGRIF